MNDEQIVVKSKKIFTQIDDGIFFDPEITPTDLAVYAALCSFADWTDHDAWPSMDTVGERAHVKSRTTTTKSLEHLEERGFIEVTRREGRSSIYEVWIKVTKKTCSSDTCSNIGQGCSKNEQGCSNIEHRTRINNENKERYIEPPPLSPEMLKASGSAGGKKQKKQLYPSTDRDPFLKAGDPPRPDFEKPDFEEQAAQWHKIGETVGAYN